MQLGLAINYIFREHASKLCSKGDKKLRICRIIKVHVLEQITLTNEV